MLTRSFLFPVLFLWTTLSSLSAQDLAEAKRLAESGQHFDAEKIYNAVLANNPDTRLVQGFEIVTGVGFGIAALMMFQISFMGLCLAFLLLPLMHHLKWENRFVRKIVYLPFILIMLGVLLSGFSVL